ncbi:MAG: 4Fe-4S binding protein [Candidatus Omnitrophica bacterium]|nr:4Fe-4S binding protein [Candidatus Omnitrophota bacterium]
MQRGIIKIDEDKCNGCGLCVPACHEGAIRIADGKARLSADALCDGLGACLGECPRGAITIEEREADAYNETAALENVMGRGDAAVQSHLKHLADHGQLRSLQEARDYLRAKGVAAAPKPVQPRPAGCGCPGGMTRDFRAEKRVTPAVSADGSGIASQLRQWPVQLRLVNPQAAFLCGADLLVSADCVPFAFAEFHRRFLQDKVAIIFCPKLDADLEEYVGKLTEVFRSNNIRSVTVVRMEVPCCGGTESIVEDALARSGKSVPLEAVTVSLRGEII